MHIKKSNESDHDLDVEEIEDGLEKKDNYKELMATSNDAIRNNQRNELNIEINND